MISWIRRLFRKTPEAKSPNLSASERQMLEGYTTLLLERLEDLRSDVTDAFQALVRGQREEAPITLHIEVFTDDPAFSFRLFSYYENQVETRRNAPVDEFNRKIDELMPILISEAIEKFIVWEDDPKYGKTYALVQPIDEVNLTELVTSWFTDIVSNIPSAYSGSITLGFHDTNSPVSIFP